MAFRRVADQRATAQRPALPLFQPLIDVLARFDRAAFREPLVEMQREIHAAGLPRFWLAEGTWPRRN